MIARLGVPATLLALLLAGCASPTASLAWGDDEAAPAAPPRPMDWSKGNWWSYRATILNTTLDVALIVHESRPDGALLGSNASAGFFGLPWSGNVTEERNPLIGPEEWPLFRLPLADGATWSYKLLGYAATTTATATTLDVPGLGTRAGYDLEAKAYGRTFARYTYSPDVAWFTTLELIEPTNGQTVLRADLTAFGPDWREAYYVEEPIRDARVAYPTLPGTIAIRVPAGYLQVRATLLAETTGGVVRAALLDDAGRTLASVSVLGTGADAERTTARPARDATWTFEHQGVGSGLAHLALTGVKPAGPLAPQSTRPEWPQLGHTTWMGVALGS